MAKYTLEGLEALRKERTLTRNEYAAFYRLSNRDEINRKARERARETYPQNKERIAAANKRWEQNNRDKANAKARRNQQAKRDKAKAARIAFDASPEGLARIAQKNEAKAQKARDSSARWRVNNPEKAKEVRQKTRAKNREKIRVYMAEWRENKSDHVQAYQRAYDERVREEKCEKRREAYAADPIAGRKRSRDWAKANPERYRLNVRAARYRRRAAKAAAGGTHTKAEIETLFFTQGGRCANPFCCVELTVETRHVDHIYPLCPQPGQKQGSNSIANLQILCQPCNQRKSNLDPAEWAKREARRAGLF